MFKGGYFSPLLVSTLSLLHYRLKERNMIAFGTPNKYNSYSLFYRLGKGDFYQGKVTARDFLSAKSDNFVS